MKNGPDRHWTNEDGQKFDGYDDGTGKTAWYDKSGQLDSVTSTPSDFEQAENDWNS